MHNQEKYIYWQCTKNVGNSPTKLELKGELKKPSSGTQPKRGQSMMQATKRTLKLYKGKKKIAVTKVDQIVSGSQLQLSLLSYSLRLQGRLFTKKSSSLSLYIENSYKQHENLL